MHESSLLAKHDLVSFDVHITVPTRVIYYMIIYAAESVPLLNGFFFLFFFSLQVSVKTNISSARL